MLALVPREQNLDLSSFFYDHKMRVSFCQRFGAGTLSSVFFYFFLAHVGVTAKSYLQDAGRKPIYRCLGYRAGQLDT
jgi:hypothetical protein